MIPKILFVAMLKLAKYLLLAGIGLTIYGVFMVSFLVSGVGGAFINDIPYLIVITFLPFLLGISFMLVLYRQNTAKLCRTVVRDAKVLGRSLAETEERLKSIRLNKELIELELRLTRSLLVPVEVVQDWGDVARIVISRLESVLNLNCLFVGFLESSGGKVYAFWTGKRDEELEVSVKEKLSRLYPGIDFELVIRQESGQREFSDGEFIDFFLWNPSVGGIVYTGLLVEGQELPSEYIGVIMGFLPALMNALGSAKALNRYTKDIESLASSDPLTGLYNQRALWKLLELEIERASRDSYPVAVLMIDIDNFKVINDTYGHEFGDSFLRSFADLLRETFRKEDIVARYGGDEFVVILPRLSMDEAIKSAERVISRVENFYIRAPDGKLLKTTVSIGVAIYPVHGDTPKELFSIADGAMYKAKTEGKGKVLPPSREDIKNYERKEGEIGLLIMESLEKELLIPAFQPIVDLLTGDIHAYEVLMRIKSDGKILHASEFVHIAEGMGVMPKLDIALMEKTIDVVTGSSFRGKLFFNLSPSFLIVEDFVKKVFKLLEKHSFPPERVVFEITERETIRNIEKLKTFTEILRKEGLSFAVDDFGSGFASFMYLKHIPVSYLKIEGEFVCSLANSKTDRAFVSSIVMLAKSIGVRTIAEFIEDEKTLNIVKELGIEYAQGFFVGRPQAYIQ